jgi:uridine phosphorylase
MLMGTKWHSKADKPTMEGGLQYHIRCMQGDVEKYCLLPGDPERVTLIAESWTEKRHIANYREHRTCSGAIDQVKLTCCSTGAGGGSTSSALEELIALGADTFIRVGTTGTIQENIACGDVIISTGAVRHDGSSDMYVEPAYPAFANYEVVAALVEATERLNIKYHLGVTCSTSSWYCGQGRPGYNGYTQSFVSKKLEDLQNAGVLNFEMEAATIFVLTGLYGLRAGAVCTVVANRVTDEFIYGGIEKSAAVANLAVQILHEWDAKKVARNKPYWFPGL